MPNNDLGATGGKKLLYLKTGTGRICVDGYFYTCGTTRGEKGYYVCSKYKRTFCRARALGTMRGNEVLNFVLTSPHNHPEDFNELCILNFMDQLKTVCQSGIELSTKEIYDDIAKLHPEAAKLKPYKSVRKSLCRWTAADPLEIKADEKHEKDEKKRKPRPRLVSMPRYVIDGFVFHANITKGKKRTMTYLRCLDYKRLGCHATAVMPSEGPINDIKLLKPHNHAPDFTIDEKLVFMRELKEVIMNRTQEPPKAIYEELCKMYPNAARETNFGSIKATLYRWRRQAKC